MNSCINRAIEYILTHLSDGITVDEIADYCNFSKFHFSRMFKAATGESVHEFIRRLKLEQSAFRLKVEKNRQITDIGEEYGYSSSNYSWAFKSHHGLSPVKFRHEIEERSLQNPIYESPISFESFEECSKKISIEYFEDTPVIYERYKENYLSLSEHWCEFTEKYAGFITKSTKMIERTYDDPSITDINSCLYDICMTAPDGCPLENIYTLRGGKFAVYHFAENAKNIYTAYQSIFNVWLPQSGSMLDERYSFDIYNKVDCDTMYMEIDICIPIK